MPEKLTPIQRNNLHMSVYRYVLDHADGNSDPVEIYNGWIDSTKCHDIPDEWILELLSKIQDLILFMRAGGKDIMEEFYQLDVQGKKEDAERLTQFIEENR